MLFETETEEEGRVDEGVAHGQPLEETKGKNANKKGRHVAGHGVAIQAEELSKHESTSGNDSSLHFMNLKMTNMARGTPTPKA